MNKRITLTITSFKVGQISTSYATSVMKRDPSMHVLRFLTLPVSVIFRPVIFWLVKTKTITKCNEAV